jgi:CelD/BcsL family acetyltransferase involved in cellulose biosynthesis
VQQRTEWIPEPGRLEELSGPWDRLARGTFEPFLRISWFLSWWDAFGADRELCTCAVWRGNELAGVFPLCATPDGRLAALSNVHSPVFHPLASDPAAERALLTAAMDRSPELVVEGVPVGGHLDRLLSGGRGRHRLCVVEPWHTSPIVDTTGSFERYRAEKKSHWREIERRRRKLRREHLVEERLIEAPADLEGQLTRGFQVEASGWKGRAGTAIASSPTTTRFYRLVAADLIRRDELRLSTLSADGCMIAFDFGLVHQARYFLLKTGFDESFRRYGPGLALRLSVIERCFELGLDSHEFLGSETDWKRLFATHARGHRVLRAYAWRPPTLTRFLYRRAARPVLARAYHRVRGSSADRATRGVASALTYAFRDHLTDRDVDSTAGITSGQSLDGKRRFSRRNPVSGESPELEPAPPAEHARAEATRDVENVFSRFTDGPTDAGGTD